MPAGSSSVDQSLSGSQKFQRVVQAATQQQKRRESIPLDLSEQYTHVVSNWARFVGFPMQHLLLVSTTGASDLSLSHQTPSLGGFIHLCCTVLLLLQ